MTGPLFACLLFASPSGVLIDRVVAVVDNEVITQSELLAEARISLVLREGEAAGAAEISEELLLAFRDYVINQSLVSQQVRRLGAVDVPEQDVERALRKFIGEFRSATAYRAFLRRFGISETAVRDIVRRNLRNERFVSQRARLLQLEPGTNSVESDSHKTAIQQWLVELRAAADLRVVGPSGQLELQ